MTVPEIIRGIVFEALNNAEDNGYDMRSKNESQIIQDLQYCCADCENLSDSALRPYVREWLKENGL